MGRSPSAGPSQSGRRPSSRPPGGLTRGGSALGKPHGPRPLLRPDQERAGCCRPVISPPDAGAAVPGKERGLHTPCRSSLAACPGGRRVDRPCGRGPGRRCRGPPGPGPPRGPLLENEKPEDRAPEAGRCPVPRPRAPQQGAGQAPGRGLAGPPGPSEPEWGWPALDGRAEATAGSPPARPAKMLTRAAPADLFII